MINQTVNSTNSNVFASFQDKRGINYAIVKPFTPMQKEEYEKRTDTKTKKLGTSIAATALVVGFGVLALMKGLPKGYYEKLNKLFVKIEDKLAKKAKDGNLGLLEKAKVQVLRGAKVTAGFIKSTYNVGPLKDVLIKKVLAKIPFDLGNKFERGITGLFERISLKTVNKRYVETSGSFEEMFAAIARFNSEASPEIKQKLAKEITYKINGEPVTKTLAEWIEYRSKIISAAYDKSFRATARNERLAEMKKTFEGLDQKIWDETYGDMIGYVKKKSTYQTFRAEEMVAPAKIKFAQDMDGLRQIISHDIQDNYKATKNLLSNIDSIIDPADRTARSHMSKVRELIKEYNELSGAAENTRRPVLTQEIVRSLNDLKAHIAGQGKYKASSDQISEYISHLNNVLSTSKKGQIQEILTLYKDILPRGDYLKFKKEIYKTVKSFNGSVETEADLLFDKLRDLKVGCAPSDALSVLASLGVIGWGLGKADNKDEKISVSLKYGIPTVGSIATALYCTARLVSGGKAILLGLLSGVAISKLGEMVDNARKNYDKDPVILDQLKLPNLKMPGSN